MCEVLAPLAERDEMGRADADTGAAALAGPGALLGKEGPPGVETPTRRGGFCTAEVDLLIARLALLLSVIVDLVVVLLLVVLLAALPLGTR